MKHVAEVAVLGQRYTIRSEATPDEVRRVAEFVNAKIAEAAEGGPADTLGSAVLALLNLGGLYLRLCEETRRDREAAERLELLLARVDKAISDSPEG